MQGILNVSWQGKNNRHYESVGWWDIPNWQDIACELYNAFNGACNPVTKEQRAAINRFNENWA